MGCFLIDEDVPRSTASSLRTKGHHVEDVRDVGLRGRSDPEVFTYAQECKATLVTCDKGFTNLLRFPVGSHFGIIVLRVPDEVPPAKLNQALLSALDQLGEEPLTGCLVVVEISRIRVRRPKDR
jgi:predicted nuclease of predicted toxin-antitoxin system